MKISNPLRDKMSFSVVAAHKAELLFSFILASILTIGHLLSRYNALDVTPIGAKIILANTFGALVLWCMLFLGLKALKQRMALLKLKPSKDITYFKNVSDKKLWVLGSIAIFSCYIPVLITARSMLSPDSWNSIAQITGDMPLNNANPLIFTMFTGMFVGLGRLIANVELGTVFFSIAQSALLAIIFARVLVWMRREGAGRFGMILAFIFYAILPINSFAGIVMWKDILFAGFGLLFLMLLRKLYLEKDAFFSAKKICCFIVFAFLFCTWRNNGIYAYELFLVLALIIDRKILFKKKYLLLLVGPAILSILYLNIIKLPAASVAKVSVPLQQIARTVKYHDSSIPNTQKQAISVLLPYDKLAERYNPALSDPIMSSLDMKAYEAHEEKLLNVWANLADDYTKTYAAAFVYNNYGYVYPFYLSPTPTDILLDNANHPNALRDYEDTAYLNGGKFAAIEWRDFVMKPVSILHNIGFYTCAILLTVYITITRKRRELIGVYLLLFGLFVSTILGPVNGEFRYLYLFVVATPFLIVATFYGGDNKPRKG